MMQRSAKVRVLTNAVAIIVLELVLIFGKVVYALTTQAGSKGEALGGETLSSMAVRGLRGLPMIAFLVLARSDIKMLFIRPERNVGRGFGRIWAVARATVLETWAARIWLLPILWFLAAGTLIMAVVPFDESERIPLYIRTILSSQEVLLLVMMWVMACVSLPRERERKTLVSTASKPISRLEILLGKLTGFGVVTAGMLGLMGALSLGILYASDARLRTRAREAYDIQKRDFNKTLQTPSEGLLQLAEQGSLFSYNNIDVPAIGGLNIGVLAIPKDDPKKPPLRYLMGGTDEKVVFHFTPRLEMHQALEVAPVGARPYFGFLFPVESTVTPVPEARIRVSASTASSPTPQEKEIHLSPAGEGFWEPDQPEQLFSTFNNSLDMVKDRGVVTLEVTCPTPGILLQILEGGVVDPATGMPPPDTVTNVEFNNRLHDMIPGIPISVAIPDPHPAVRGFERRDRQEIKGPKRDLTDAEADQLNRELAIYRFSGESLRDVPVESDGTFRLSVQLETFKADHPTDPTYAGIVVRSLDPTGAPDFVLPRLEVLEKRVMTVHVPAANLGRSDPKLRGDMVVMLYCASPGQSISLIENSVRIELPRSPFFLNLFKSELILFVKAMLLVTIGVTCSVRLGWPVAMFCSAICIAFGLMVDFIASIVTIGGVWALNYNRPAEPDAVYHFFDKSATLAWNFLGFIASVVPNFTVFKPDQFIGNLQNMPWSVVWSNTGTALAFALPFVALSYLMFRKQELG